MGEQRDEGHEPAGTSSPADDARIRRLLAEARHTEPMPADVAERLEGVLADLQAERDATTAPVVDLAARRRRTAASFLVAAAAVVVAGVGVGTLVPGLGGGSDDSPSSAQAPAADRAEEAEGTEGGGESLMRGSEESPVVPSPEESPVVPSPEASTAAPIRIRAEHFGADVRRARAGEPDRLGDPDAVKSYAGPVCPVGDVGPGTAVAATYDGTPAYLVLRPPAGDVQVVDLYICGTDEPARTITLAVP